MLKYPMKDDLDVEKNKTLPLTYANLEAKVLDNK